MVLSNQEIYNKALSLQGIFADSNIYLPARLNFYLNKNIDKIFAAAREIEQERYRILTHYGVKQEDGLIHLQPEAQEKAQNELDNFLIETQDIEIKEILLSWFENLSLTPNQMQTLLFMIKED